MTTWGLFISRLRWWERTPNTSSHILWAPIGRVPVILLHLNCYSQIKWDQRSDSAGESCQTSTKEEQATWTSKARGGPTRCLGASSNQDLCQRVLLVGDWFYTPPVLGVVAVFENSAPAVYKNPVPWGPSIFYTAGAEMAKTCNTSQQWAGLSGVILTLAHLWSAGALCPTEESAI